MEKVFLRNINFEKFEGFCISMANVQVWELMRLQAENCYSIPVRVLCSKYLVFNAVRFTSTLFFLALQLKFMGCFLHIFFKSACILHILHKFLAIFSSCEMNRMHGLFFQAFCFLKPAIFHGWNWGTHFPFWQHFLSFPPVSIVTFNYLILKYKEGWFISMKYNYRQMEGLESKNTELRV